MSDEIDALVTDLHAVNSALVDNGFGPQLLCTLVAFADEEHRRMALVYLYKRGTFYPFAPLSERGSSRDNALELQVKGVLERGPEDRARPHQVDGALGRPRIVTFHRMLAGMTSRPMAGMPAACVQLKANDGAAQRGTAHD